MEVYYDKYVKEKRAKVIESLGRLKIEDFKANKDKYKNIFKRELKKILEQF